MVYPITQACLSLYCYTTCLGGCILWVIHILAWVGVYTSTQTGLGLSCYTGLSGLVYTVTQAGVGGCILLLHRLVWVGVYWYTDWSRWVYTGVQTGLDECLLVYILVWMGVYLYTDWSGWVYTGKQTGLDGCILLHTVTYWPGCVYHDTQTGLWSASILLHRVTLIYMLLGKIYMHRNSVDQDLSLHDPCDLFTIYRTSSVMGCEETVLVRKIDPGQPV